jgi:Zn-dependent protease with chaperone function
MPAAAPSDRTARMQPLWVRVDANRTKLTVFVVLFVLGSALLLSLALVAVPGALIGFAFATPGSGYWSTYAFSVVGAVVVLLAVGSLAAAIQLANAEDWVKNRFSGRDLEAGEAPELESALADMAIAAGLSAPPRVLVLAEEGENAFALGTARKRAVVGITEGMLHAFTADELRAVVATLIARITAGDIMFATALAALMGPVQAIRGSRKGAGAAATGCANSGCSDPGCGPGCSNSSGCIDIGDLGDSDSAGGCLGAIGIALFIAFVIAVTYVALLTATWIVTLWGRALQRTSYEKADAEGMLLLKDPSPMISALRKSILSSNFVASGDQSYDGIFYSSTSGTPKVDRAERRRFERLCEVLGVEGLMASLDSTDESLPPESPSA